METLDISPEETATSETTAASASDKAEAIIKPKTLPISISVSYSEPEFIAVSALKPESHLDNKSDVKSELTAASDLYSSPEIIVPTDLLSVSASDSKSSAEPRLKHVSEGVLVKVSSPNPLEVSTEIKQGTSDSVPKFETTQIDEESIAVSTEIMNLESGLATEIMTISNPAVEPKVASKSDDAMSKLTPTFQSVLQFASTAVVEQNALSASATASKETVQPESTPEFDVKATSQSVFEPNIVYGLDNISRLKTVPEPVSAFETATSERCKNFAFNAALKDSVKLEPASHFVISEEPDPIFEPKILCTPIITTESVPVLETFAALEKDKELPSVPFFEEIIQIKSDNVLEVSEVGDAVHESSISSTSDVASKSIPASEPIPVITTTSVSELDVERASISPSNRRTEFGSFAVSEIAVNPASTFEPRRLNISSTNQIVKTEQYNISDSDHRFHVLLDVSRYYTDSLSIHIIGDKIDVFGLEKSDDDFGEEYHEIHKIFVIPEYVDDSSLTACITESDSLLLYAPLKKNINADIKNVK